MQKIYVLDTNILIQSPEAIFRFEDNAVILPLALIEELDGLKTCDGDKGRSAREAIRRLEQLRGQGDLLAGVATPDGGTICATGTEKNKKGG